MSKRVLVLLLVVSLVFLTNCNNKTEKLSSERNKIKCEKNTIIIAQWGHTKYLIYLPLYVAMEKGFFAEQGLNVKLKYSGNDDQVFATVLSGNAIVGIGDPVFTIIAREKRGIKGKVISLIVEKPTIWGVTNKNVEFINSPEKLSVFKTIGTFPAPSTTYTIVKNIIKTNKLNIKIIESPIDSQLALLEKGVADVVMLLEPAASFADVQKKYKVVFSLPELWGKFAFTGINTTEEMIEKHPLEIKGILKAMDKSFQYIYACKNDDTKKRELVTLTKNKILPTLPRIVIQKAIDRLLKDEVFPKKVGVDKNAWEKALEIRKEVGDLKSLKYRDEIINYEFK